MFKLQSAFLAGLAYFAVVFTAGFILGIVRVTFVLPYVSEIIAVAIELPLILLISWLACRLIVRRQGVAGTIAARGLMGLTAFVLLIAAELVLGTIGLGRTLTEQLARYRLTPELLGLIGQLLFAAFPLIQLNTLWRKSA
jgi:hypothetical protein